MAPKQQTKKKSSNTRKNSNAKAKQMNIKETGAIHDEIILVVALVISILLFLSNFDLGGAVGKAFSGFIFGLIGLEAYILPFVVFFITAFRISNLGNPKAGRKIMSSLVFFIALSAFLQLITTQYDPDMHILQYFTDAKDNHNGGGILGGMLVMLFCSLFEVPATYVILIAVMLIALTLITGKALILYVGKQIRASLKERKEYQRIRMQEEELDEFPGQEYLKSDNGRRPAKTFLLNPASADKKTSGSTLQSATVNSNDSVVTIKEAKAKKEQTTPETKASPFQFQHIFNSSRKEEEEGATFTYEEELLHKFGNHTDSDTDYNEVPFVESIKESIEEEPIPPISSIASEAKKDLPPPEKTPASKVGSTDVEKLEIPQTSQQKEYIFPPVNLLSAPKAKATKGGMSDKELKETAMKLQSTFESFGVHVTITNASVGPAVTRYELQPEQGVKVSRITSLADDIKLNLAAADIRIEAPIPGKAAVGIEVPNKENSMVTFREIIESKDFTGHPSGVAFAVGKDIGGQSIITDIAKMPHLLIAGATGSGKSVCINTLIMSILYKSKPSDVRLIMVDPKVVELNVYNGIPHLLIPVVTDPKKASAALNWAVMEMTDRYKRFADVGVRDLKGYNEKVAEVEHLGDENFQKLPQIVIIIDELADLMMVAPGEVEDAICRLAQLARAAGLHLIIATQRPSVNVITGVIKANIPSRIAFAVSSAIDSRTILDGSGAEKLLGKGDMLFFPSGYPKPVRIQGAFISDKEVSSVVEFLKKNNNEATYNDDVHDKINNARAGEGSLQGSGDERDEYFAEAGKFIIEKDKASIGMLQRVYKIGFNRAARIMDQLSDAGVVGPEEGTKPRKVLMSPEQFEQYLDEY